MGERSSISLRQQAYWGDEDTYWESVVVFNHWGGMHFVREAFEYFNKLVHECRDGPSNGADPHDRMEPAKIIVPFIVKHASQVYLGRDMKNGDNSDHGHWVIILPRWLRNERKLIGDIKIEKWDRDWRKDGWDGEMELQKTYTQPPSDIELEEEEE